MNYQLFTREDFALNENFQKWVLQPTQEQDTFWINFMNNFPEKENDIMQAKELVLDAGLTTDSHRNMQYLQVWRTLNENMENEKYHGHKSNNKNSTLFRYAAVFIGFLIISAITLFVVVQNKKIITYQAGFGETKTIQLPDGSTVTLNSNSLISFSEDIKNRESREVFLKGEAFFSVKRMNDKRLFIVNTPDQFNVVVYGTEFNVNTNGHKPSVYLKSGRVKVKLESKQMAKEVELFPGDIALYSKENEELITKKGTEDSYIGWRKNMFIFYDTPLKDVAIELENFTGKKVVFDDESLQSLKLTAKISRENIDLLLQVLSESLQANFIIEKNTIIIQKE